MGVLESFPRITPFLWFDNNAEDAVNFYLSVFKNSRRLEALHHNGNRPAPLSSTARSSRRSTEARCSNLPKRSRS
jgi:predicted 3-demethylubiquinone-9 3-methyltransferase (glyoxalase superfamily)